MKGEAAEWKPPSDLALIPVANLEDIPVLDLTRYLSALASLGASHEAATELNAAREEIAAQLKDAGQQTGFCTIQGFGSVASNALDEAFKASKAFHSLPEAIKLSCEMDNTSKVGEIGGVGYLREENRKLPARDQPNCNASFIIKRERGPRNVHLTSMPWPQSHIDHSCSFDSVAFRETVTSTALALEALAVTLLPVYATALGLEPTYKL